MRLSNILPICFLKGEKKPTFFHLDKIVQTILTVVRSSPQILTYTKQENIYKDLDLKKMQTPNEIEIVISGKVDRTKIPFEEYIKKSKKFLSECFKVDDGILKKSFCFPPDKMCSDDATKLASLFLPETELNNDAEKTMVIISHYDIQQHFQLLDVNFHEICDELKINVNTIGNPDDRFLVFNLQNNSIINVRYTEENSEENAVKALDDGDIDTRLFLYFFGKQLLASQISIINVVAAPNITEHCDNLLVLNKDDLSKGKLRNKLRSLSNLCNRRKSEIGIIEPALMTTMISLAFSYLAITRVRPSLLYESVSTKIKSMWLTPEQIKAIFSGKCWKIVRGCYGSGKSVVGRYLIQHLAKHATKHTDVFYVVLDRNSLLLQDMINFSENIKKEHKSVNDFNIICLNTDSVLRWLCDFVKDYSQYFSLSLFLKTLVSNYKHTDRNFHLFVDEVDNEMIDEKEAKYLHDCFVNDNDYLQDSYIVFMNRSLEKEREWYNGDIRQRHRSYQHYEKCNMEVFNLSASMRVSRNVHDVITVALKGITKPNIIPQPDLEASKEVTSVEQQLHYPDRMPQQDFITNFESGESRKVINESESMEQQDVSGTATVNQQFSEQSVVTLPLKMMDPNEVEELGGEYARSFKNSSSKIVCSYRFNESQRVGHSMYGQRPKMIFLHNYELKGINDESSHTLLHSDNIKCLAEAMKEYCFSEKNNSEKTLIICTDSEEITMFKQSLNLLHEDFNVYIDSKDLSQAQLNANILITDHNGSRGLEYGQVVVTINPGEIYRRQFLIEAMCRCTDHLLLLIPYVYKGRVLSTKTSPQQKPKHELKKSTWFTSLKRKLTGWMHSNSEETVSAIIESLKTSDCLDLISYSTQDLNSQEPLTTKKEGNWTKWLINKNKVVDCYVNEGDQTQSTDVLWGNTSERFEKHLEESR